MTNKLKFSSLDIISIIIRLVCIGLNITMSCLSFSTNEIKDGICWANLAFCFTGLILLEVYRKFQSAKYDTQTEEEDE